MDSLRGTFQVNFCLWSCRAAASCLFNPFFLPFSSVLWRREPAPTGKGFYFEKISRVFFTCDQTSTFSVCSFSCQALVLISNESLSEDEVSAQLTGRRLLDDAQLQLFSVSVRLIGQKGTKNNTFSFEFL